MFFCLFVGLCLFAVFVLFGCFVCLFFVCLFFVCLFVCFFVQFFVSLCCLYLVCSVGLLIVPVSFRCCFGKSLGDSASSEDGGAPEAWRNDGHEPFFLVIYCVFNGFLVLFDVSLKSLFL